MNVLRTALQLMTVAFALQAGDALAKEYACPEKATKPETVSLYDGPPSEMADLKPDNGDDMNAKSSVWTLFDNPHGFWMACNYAGMSERFTRRLDNPKTSCAVTVKNSGVTGLNCE